MQFQDYDWLFGKTPPFVVQHSFIVVQDDVSIPVVSDVHLRHIKILTLQKSHVEVQKGVIKEANFTTSSSFIPLHMLTSLQNAVKGEECKNEPVNFLHFRTNAHTKATLGTVWELVISISFGEESVQLASYSKFPLPLMICLTTMPARRLLKAMQCREQSKALSKYFMTIFLMLSALAELNLYVMELTAVTQT